MWQIRKEFADYTHPLQKGWLYLNADPPINPSSISYPISWIGTIGGIKVRIIQKDRETISVDDFEFIEFPEKYAHLMAYIVDWIDEALKILD
jgi:hypothetical protein